MSYGRTFLKSLRFIAHDVQISSFSHSVRNRYRRLRKKAQGHPNKHRAGWRVALRRHPINKMTVPSIISSNVRSLLGKIDDVKNLVQQKYCKNVGVILLQESWLHPDIEDDVVRLDGFDIFRGDRNVNFLHRGGGVVTFVNRQWCNNSHLLFQFHTSKINSTFVYCKPRFLSRFHHILLANIYIAPDTPVSDITLLADSFSTQFGIGLEQSLCITAGDFNRSDISFLTTSGLVNLVHFPTRLNAQLDGIFVNNPDIFFVEKRAPISTSDHCILFLQPKIYGKRSHYLQARSASRTIMRRDCSPDNLARLQHLVSSTDFSLFSSSDNSSNCEHLTDYLNFCFDLCCPVETVYIRADRFSSPLLKRLRRDKEKAYMTDRRNDVKLLSVLIKREIQRLNRMYIESILGNKSCREMWSALKQLCGKHERSCPDVEELNRQFSAASDPNILPASFPLNEELSTVSPTEVLKVLKQLKSNKAHGPDSVSPILLKSCAEQLAIPIAELFNLCMFSGTIPNCWRSARIRPIPKKGSSKYRPIACTSALLKVFERVLLNRMTILSDVNDPLQFAYKPSHSTLDAVALVVHSVLSSLDKGAGIVRLTFLDYANAFGSLDRGILIQRLSDCGLGPDVLNVLIDYFSHRTQFTSCNGKTSSSLEVNSGVFQGAILSPFLFSLYINNLPVPPDFIACKYADDVVIGCPSLNPDSFHQLQNSLNDIFSWSLPRSLTLNVSKCVDVPFSLKNGSRYQALLDNLPELNVNSLSIPKAESVKYLGVILSHNLSWSYHVDNVYNRVRRLSFYAFRLKKLTVPQNVILKFVTACILPHWLYCSPVIFPGLKKRISSCFPGPLNFFLDAAVFPGMLWSILSFPSILMLVIDSLTGLCLTKTIFCIRNFLNPFLALVPVPNFVFCLHVPLHTGIASSLILPVF